MDKISIIHAADHVDQPVTIGVWLSNKRVSGKIAFLQLRGRHRHFSGGGPEK